MAQAISRRYRLRHLTRYQYQSPVLHSYHLSCLQPRELPQQQVVQSRQLLLPKPQTTHSYTDCFGNQRQFFHLNEPHQQLDVEVRAELLLTCRDTAALPGQGGSLAAALAEQTAEPALAWYRQASPLVPLLPEAAAIWRQLQRPELDLLSNVARLNQYIFSEFRYQSEATTVTTPLSAVLHQRAGVCQDFAQLAIAVLRSQGFAARYVSGYLETSPPPGQPKLQGADASHAWFAVYDAVHGWVEFDPTNNLLPDHQHVRLAFGRDYADVVPFKGVVQGGGQHQLSVEVDLVPEPATAQADR